MLDRDEFFAYAAKGSGEIRTLLKRGVLEETTEEDAQLDKVVEVFKAWDTDGDGHISRKELERIFITLNPSFTKKELDSVMKAADKNGDGMIDYTEFADWLKDSGKKPAGRR